MIFKLLDLHSKIRIIWPCIADPLILLESRSFWIGWQQDVITVGKGLVPFQHQLVEFAPVGGSYRIQAVSFKTAEDADGVWTIDKLAGKHFDNLSISSLADD